MIFNRLSKIHEVNEYLKQSTTVNCKLEDDARSFQRYLIINEPNINAIPSNFFDKIANFIPNTPLFAQVGNDAVLKLLDNNLIIFKNLSATELQDRFFHHYDESELSYEITITTAEYHSFITLRNTKNPNGIKNFGGAVFQKGNFVGDLYVRSDNYYHAKYFREPTYLKPGEINPVFDKGSISITFPITEAQAMLAIEKVKNDSVNFMLIKPYFNLFGLQAGINCAEYANSVLNHIGIPGFFGDYYRGDQLDMHDKGIIYLFWKSHGTLTTILHSNDMVRDLISYSIYGESFGETINHFLKGKFLGFALYKNTSLHLDAMDDCINASTVNPKDLNAVNDFGNTPLIEALILGKTNAALKLLDLGADFTISNSKGFSALHYAASLEKSAQKQEILTKMLANTSNVDALDHFNSYTPLAFAVKSNDIDAVKLFIEHGANINFINNSQDSLIDIAVSHSSYDVIEPIYSLHPELLIRDNLESQIPLCTLKELPNFNQILPNFDDKLLENLTCKNQAELLSFID
jgi:hypothetical protein